MPTTKLFACARAVLIDKYTNSMSVIEVIEEFTCEAFPAGIPKLAVIWLKERDIDDPEKENLRFEVLRDGTLKAEYPIAVDYEGKSFHRSIVNLQAVVLDAPGTIEFRVVRQQGSRKTTLAALSLNIKGGNALVIDAPQAPTDSRNPIRKRRKTLS
jgi:hypothetical protein